MKNFKKVTAAIAATLMAATMVAPMALNSFAAENVSLTLTAPQLPAGATIQKSVTAYKVFDITWVDETAKTDVNVTGWASDVNGSAIATAWANYLNTGKAEDATDKVSFSGDNVAAAVAATLTNANAEDFAKIVMSNLAEAATGTSGRYASNAVTFTSIDDGYYAMSCTVKAANGDDYDAQSLGMLTVVGATATTGIGDGGTAKVGLPEVVKKVKEDTHIVTGYDSTTTNKIEQQVNADNADTTDGDWNDVADYDIGDSVPFKLYGSLPDDFAKYNKYFYQFNDTLDNKFTITDDTAVTVKIDGYVVDSGVVVNKDTTSNKITVTFEDLKIATVTGAEEGYAINKNSIITVEYSAVLNATANLAPTGQENMVSLTYSNNPNQQGAGETGTTPDDKVKVYTYAFEIEKEFFDGSGSPLTQEEVTEGVYSKVEFSLTKGNDKVKVRKATEEEKVAGWDYVVDDTSNITSMTLTEFTDRDGDGVKDLVIRIKGLDDGTYTLKEEVAPDGYNKAPDQTVVIKGGTVNDQTWNGTDDDTTIESFGWTVTPADATDATVDKTQTNNITGIANTMVENKKGTSLPSTGGIGTTLFYLGGGAMVAVAGVFLITKKRMGKDEA